jgi:hypothetical protein
MKKDALDFLKAVKQDPMAMKTFEERELYLKRLIAKGA